MLMRYVRPGLQASIVLALFGTWGVSALLGQSFEAQMTGTVRDTSGAVVPNVQITATNLSTKASFKTATNESGLYRLPALPPAEYKISCTTTGFKTFEQGPIVLQVAQVLELNVTLQIGSATERIEVTDTPPQLETVNSTLGQVVATRDIVNLPLNVRDPLALLALAPGVVIGSNFGNGGGQDVGRNFFKSDFYVGGGRSGSQEILLDGAPNTTADVSRNIIDPPVDSVQEFKVQHNSFDAQYGRTSGAVINIITKSGGNTYHGTAYDFERHSIMDANDFFSNRSGIALKSFQRHQFGGNIGGPVVKSKVFLFGDYEGIRQGFPVSTLSTVPTALQKSGDFSQTFYNNKGTPALIGVYDPTTVLKAANGTYQRSPFPGNVIPSSRFDSVSKNVLPYFQTANLAGDAITGTNNYIYSAPVDHQWRQVRRPFRRHHQRPDALFRALLAPGRPTFRSGQHAAARRRRPQHQRRVFAGRSRRDAHGRHELGRRFPGIVLARIGRTERRFGRLRPDQAWPADFDHLAAHQPVSDRGAGRRDEASPTAPTRLRNISRATPSRCSAR